MRIPGRARSVRRSPQPDALPVKPCSSTSVRLVSCAPERVTPMWRPFTCRTLCTLLPLMQGLLDKLPELTMHTHIAGAFSWHLDDMQATFRQPLTHDLPKLLPGCDTLEVAAIHAHDWLEIQSSWRTKELLKVLRIGGLRQEGEDAAAIIIDQHNHQVQTMQFGRQ